MGLARSFQTSALFDGLTAGENVRLAMQAAGPAPFSPFRAAGSAAGRAASTRCSTGSVCRVARPRSPATSRTATVASSSWRWRWPPTRRLLLLDEPMAGVSAEDVDGLSEIIGEVRDSGVAVAMVEHHMHVVLGLADRVAVLHHGELLAVGAPAEVTSDERVQQAYLGEAL